METYTFEYEYTGDNPGLVQIDDFPTLAEWMKWSPKNGGKLFWGATEHLKLRMFQGPRMKGETDKLRMSLDDFEIPEGADPKARIKKAAKAFTRAELLEAAAAIEAEDKAKAAKSADAAE